MRLDTSNRYRLSLKELVVMLDEVKSNLKRSTSGESENEDCHSDSERSEEEESRSNLN